MSKLSSFSIPVRSFTFSKLLFFYYLQVIHYELPNDPKTCVHRSGRTGRASKEGSAILMFIS
ncbi:hypothetical protein Sjap_011984 [Stephania japonica]|uniref:Uncharacterized protein n=1 Tax=Stephania japonica TaxID=461633 RepID=A0AAP0P567_9MAGN